MPGRRKGTRLRVLEAAAASILEDGVRNMTLDEIAARAGVGRQTLYRHFGRRELFLEAILLERFKVIVDAVKQVIDTSDSFETAVVQGSLETLRLSSVDPVYLAIAEAERELHVDLLMLGKDSGFERQFLEIWLAVFETAQREGVLRADVAIEQATEWLRNAHFLLAHRTDLDAAGIEQMLRVFVLPGLIDSRR